MIQLSVKTVGAEVVRQGLEDLTAEIPKIGRARIYEKMREAKSILSTPGLPSTSPVQWDSEKQRRFVLAKLREENNLPYRRTGRMPRGWSIYSTPTGYRFENDNQNAVYVYGNFEGARQSRIHAGRHPIMQQVVEQKIQELPPDIESRISYYARQKGF